jgi:hypothetical protein
MVRLRWLVLLSASVAVSAWNGGVRAAGSAPQVGQAMADDPARLALSGAWVMNSQLSDIVEPEDVAEENLVLTCGADVVKFYQRDGSWRVYRLSARRERHDLGSGPVWTRTSWNGTTLRIQIDGPHGLRIVQTFALDADTGRLVVTTSPDPHRLPMNTLKLVYDPVIARNP